MDESEEDNKEQKKRDFLKGKGDSDRQINIGWLVCLGLMAHQSL